MFYRPPFLITKTDGYWITGASYKDVAIPSSLKALTFDIDLVGPGGGGGGAGGTEYYGSTGYGPVVTGGQGGGGGAGGLIQYVNFAGSSFLGKTLRIGCTSAGGAGGDAGPLTTSATPQGGGRGGSVSTQYAYINFVGPDTALPGTVGASGGTGGTGGGGGQITSNTTYIVGASGAGGSGGLVGGAMNANYLAGYDAIAGVGQMMPSSTPGSWSCAQSGVGTGAIRANLKGFSNPGGGGNGGAAGASGNTVYPGSVTSLNNSGGAGRSGLAILTLKYRRSG